MENWTYYSWNPTHVTDIFIFSKTQFEDIQIIRNLVQFSKLLDKSEPSSPNLNDIAAVIWPDMFRTKFPDDFIIYWTFWFTVI